jgi:hypothetical protein
MALSLQKTSKDFDTLKTEMVAKIPLLAPLWTNLNEGDLGMVLINLIAGAGDMLGYMLDRSTDETFLPTAVTREAVQRLCALIDYRLSRPVAAKTTLRFTLPSAVVGTPVLIPKYTQVKTAAGVYFTTKDDAYIYAGRTYVDVDGYQGKFWSDAFVGTGVDLQELKLSHSNVAQNFLTVLVGAQVWTEDSADNTAYATTLYDVATDVNESATVRFSTYLGDVPSQNTTVVARYVETLGAAGNVGSGVVNAIVQMGDNSAVPTGLTVSNTTVASGGADREAVDHARVNAPRRLRTLGRAVTLQDFEDLLEGFPGVAKAQAINHNGYAECYVAPDNGVTFFLPAPTVAATGSTTGGTLPAGTYKVRATAVDANGETTASEYNPSDRTVIDRTQTVTIASGATSSISATVTPVTGATAYRYWISNDSGATWRLYQQTAGTTQVMTSLPAPSATFPTANTTGARSSDAATSLRQAIEAYLEARRLIGTVFAVFNPTYVQVNVTATVTIYNNYLQSAVQGAVTAALQSYFAFTNQGFATAVPLSDLYAVVMGVDGVRSVSFTAPSGDTAITNGQLAQLGTVALTMSGGVVG